MGCSVHNKGTILCMATSKVDSLSNLLNNSLEVSIVKGFSVNQNFINRIR